MTKRMVLIDGTNMAFRAFYAIPPLTSSKGMPTNALHGYANILVNFLKTDRPDYIAVAFDAKGPTLRKQKYEAYKAQRKPTPPELIQQLPYFRKVTEALNIPFLELSSYEADDIIATLVKASEGKDIHVEIISMDKDLMQLVNDRVTAIDTLKGKTYDPKGVEEKWGVPPERLRDLLALQGDSSDNIPGVPGIGPKKAAALLKDFSTLPELLENLDKVSNARMRETLTTNAEAARLSYELVTLYFDVPLDMTIEQLEVKEPDPEACFELFRELELNRLLREFGAVESNEVPLDKRVTTVDDRSSLEAMISALAGSKVVALTTSGAAKDGSRLDSLALAASSERAWLIVWNGSIAEDSSLRELLGTVLANTEIPKIGHDLKQDLRRLASEGLRLEGMVGDTETAAYLANPSRSSYTLDKLTPQFLRRNLLSDPEGFPGCGEVFAILEIHEILTGRLEENGMGELYRDLELPMLKVLGEMELRGIRLDTDKLAAMSADFERRIGTMNARIIELAGEEFNPNSPKQLQAILFEKLELPVVKKTKTGPSTDHSVLETLAEKHPLPAEILAYRTVVKLKNTYIDALPKLVSPSDGRVHTTFNLTVAATGRLSSSDPNLQNIPVRTEEGREIRAAFVPDPGWILMSADYSQIELRLLAHMSEDEKLISAFTEGLDIHRATASDIFNVAVPLVTQSMRRSAKAINFGILYGMGAFRLANELKIKRKEAEAYIKQYFDRYERVRGFLDKTLEMARQQGFVTTLFNRRRYVPELSSKNFNLRQGAERIAINTPIQGSAADIIKMAMRDVAHGLVSEGLRTRMLLQVHDELVFEVPAEELDLAKELIKSKMEKVVKLRIPLTVDVGSGKNWAEAH